MNDGKAQGFDKWFKEYIFNLLIQPLHLLLYYMLVTSAWELFSSNMLYSIIALGFMMPAEKLLRNFFGFEKAHTPGLLAGPGGAALTMGALNKIAGIGGKEKGKGSLGNGGSDNNSSNNNKITWANRGVDEKQMTAENAKDENNDNNNENMPNSNDDYEQYLGDVQDHNEGRDIDNQKTPEELAEEDPNYMYMHPELFESNGNENEQTDNNDARVNDNNEQQVNVEEPRQQGKDTNESKIRQLARMQKLKAGRKLRSVGGGIKRGFVGNAKQQLRNAPKNLGKTGVRFIAKTAAGTAMGAIGLAAGVVSGDPNKAFQYAATAGAAGASLGGRAANGLINNRSSYYQEAYNRRYNDEKYDEINREEYIKDFKEKNKDAMILNLGKRKYNEMVKKGSIDKLLDGGIDNVEDLIAAQKMIDNKDAKDEAQAAAYAKYAGRVGTDYNNANATKWEKRLTKEYVEKVGLDNEKAASTAKKTMGKVDKFNKYKKEIK